MKKLFGTLSIIVVFFNSTQGFSGGMTEEIRALKKEVNALLERIEHLEAKQKEEEESEQTTPEPLEVASKGKILGPLEVKSGNDKIKLTLSGQVNRMLLYGDNGHSNRVQHVDNNNISTRFRLQGEGRLDEDLVVKARFEAEMRSNSSSSVDIKDSPASASSVTLTERRLEILLESQSFGTFFIGQGNMASTDTSETDLSKTRVIALGGSAHLMAGGFRFEDRLGKGPRIGSVYTSLDGIPRTDRIRYDTPRLYGFSLGGSHGSGDERDVSLKFKGENEDLKAKAAISLGSSPPNNYTQVQGSGSILFPCGVSIGAAGGKRNNHDLGRKDSFFVHGKLGYQKQFFDLGLTAFAVDFGQAWHMDANKDRARLYGAFLVQHVHKLAMEVYLGIRNHELHRVDRDFHSILAIAMGARIQF